MAKVMTIFLKKLFLFGLLFLAGALLCFLYKYYETDEDKRIGHDVYHAIYKSKTKKQGVKVLILGDSVGRQAYNVYAENDSIYSLACNMAISMIGQYVLLSNFLEKYKTPEKLNVVLIYRASSFRNNLDQCVTYNYFLKPFYTRKNKPLFTDLAMERIRKIPYYYIACLPFIKNSNWSPPYMVGINYPNDFSISRLSAQYLLKMKELCVLYGVRKFKIISPYMSDKFDRECFAEFDKQIKRYGLSDIFDEYYDKILFLNKELFGDGIHLKKSALLGENYMKF